MASRVCHGHKSTQEPHLRHNLMFLPNSKGGSLAGEATRCRGSLMWAGQVPPYFSFSGREDRTFLLILFPFLSWPPLLWPCFIFSTIHLNKNTVGTEVSTSSTDRERSDYRADKGEINDSSNQRKENGSKKDRQTDANSFWQIAFKPENKSKYKYRKLRMPALVL